MKSSASLLALVLSSLILFGQFYAYDIPSILQPQLRQLFISHSMDPQDFNLFFSLLYSLYGFPNIILPLLFGLLIDKVGVNLMILVLTSLLFLGHLCVTFGVLFASYSFYFGSLICLIGRFIFGIGGESLGVAVTALLARYWFRDKDLSFALGVNLAVARLGSVATDIMSPLFASLELGLLFSFYVGGFILGISFLCSVILYQQSHSIEEQKQEQLRFDFSRDFWLMSFVCSLLYAAVVPFNIVAAGLLFDVFYSQMNLIQAQKEIGLLMSLLYLISALFSPFLGMLLDRNGKRFQCILVSAWLCLLSHFLMLKAPPFLSVLLLGIGYAGIATAIWPAISMLLNPEVVGSGLGAATALQNLGLFVTPLVVANFNANYVKIEGLFCGLVFTAVTLLYVFDWKFKNAQRMLDLSFYKEIAKE